MDKQTPFYVSHLRHKKQKVYKKTKIYQQTITDGSATNKMLFLFLSFTSYVLRNGVYELEVRVLYYYVIVCDNCESGCIWSTTNNRAECGVCKAGYMRDQNSFSCVGKWCSNSCIQVSSCTLSAF